MGYWAAGMTEMTSEFRQSNGLKSPNGTAGTTGPSPHARQAAGSAHTVIVPHQADPASCSACPVPGCPLSRSVSGAAPQSGQTRLPVPPSKGQTAAPRVQPRQTRFNSGSSDRRPFPNKARTPPSATPPHPPASRFPAWFGVGKILNRLIILWHEAF